MVLLLSAWTCPPEGRCPPLCASVVKWPHHLDSLLMFNRMGGPFDVNSSSTLAVAVESRNHLGLDHCEASPSRFVPSFDRQPKDACVTTVLAKPASTAMGECCCCLVVCQDSGHLHTPAPGMLDMERPRSEPIPYTVFLTLRSVLPSRSTPNFIQPPDPQTEHPDCCCCFVDSSKNFAAAEPA